MTKWSMHEGINYHWSAAPIGSYSGARVVEFKPVETVEEAKRQLDAVVEKYLRAKQEIGSYDWTAEMIDGFFELVRVEDREDYGIIGQRMWFVHGVDDGLTLQS